MSRLLAIDVKSINNYRDLQFLLSHIGQTKDYFLAQIPAAIEIQLHEVINNFSEIERLKSIELIKKLKHNFAIINVREDKKYKDFKPKITNFYQTDKRLELAITDITDPKPFKSINDLDEEDWGGLKSLELEPKDNYSEEDRNKIWNYLEFYLRTAPKICLLGRYNYIFNPENKKPTNLHLLLTKFFQEFKKNGCRCEELIIYAAPPENQYKSDLAAIEKQRDIIKEYFDNLMSLKKIKYGIKYYAFHDKEISQEIHQRFLITSYALIGMGDEFSTSKNRSLISPISDLSTIHNYQNRWLESNYHIKNPLIIST